MLVALCSLVPALPGRASSRIHDTALLAAKKSQRTWKPQRTHVRTDKEYRGDGRERAYRDEREQQQGEEKGQQEEESVGRRRRRYAVRPPVAAWPAYGAYHARQTHRVLPTHIAFTDAVDEFAVKHVEWVLKKACPGQRFTTGAPRDGAPGGQFLVGAAGHHLVREQGALDKLGDQAFLVDSSSNDSHVLLSGKPGHPRGTLLAVSHLLHALGVRHLAATETIVPACPSSVPRLFVAAQPSFEYRDNDQLQIAGNAKWASLVGYNGQSLNETDDRKVGVGGRVSYASPPGFVHTSYQLLAYPKEAPFGYDGKTRVPPHELVRQNPEWFWPPTPGSPGQLCWSNPELVRYLTQQSLAVLEQQPHAQILSVSQEDNGNMCQRDEEVRINREEGSDMGAMLRAVNSIAEAVGKKHPHVAIDTLAYQWSRAPPRRTVPRHNVVIRLCTIECDFAHSMSHPHNKPFVKDLEGWARISNRTYIWDYITNFNGYLAPFPNWYRLGPTLQFLHERGVRGVFAEGVYNGHGGGDLAELKDYVLARLMMNVSDDANGAIREFIDGYYGRKAAPFVRMYMHLMHGAVDEQNFHMSFSHDADAPFLRDPVVLLAAADAFGRAEKVSEGRFAARVRRAGMGVHYVALHHWAELHNFTAANQMGWPFPEISQRAMFGHFQSLISEFDVTLLDEWGGNMTSFEHKLFHSGRASALAFAAPMPLSAAASKSAMVSLQTEGDRLYHRGAAPGDAAPYRSTHAPRNADIALDFERAQAYWTSRGLPAHLLQS